jgi:uncharacterized protein (DUF433 family)
MRQALSTAEVVALTGLDERRVRKDVELGVLDAETPPQFEMREAVYFRAIAVLGFDLGVEDRKKLYGRIRDAFRAKTLPRRLPLSQVLVLELDEVASWMKKRVARFEAWKAKLVEDEAILGGEPVFPKTRLAVRQIGGMLLAGAPVDEVKEDYPYLSDEDIELAELYTVAYPRLGRPREAAPR